MASYFNLPSVLVAKKNQEQLQNNKPQTPVLNEEDENFFNQQIEAEKSKETLQNALSADKSDPATVGDSAQRSTGQAEGGDDKPKTNQSKKGKGMELPSQEEAEASTRGFHVQTATPNTSSSSSQDKLRTWTTYVKSSIATNKANTSTGNQDQAESSNEASKHGQSTTWAEYASSYVPSSVPSIPSLPTSWKRKRKDAEPESVYNEDGTVNEEKTREKQEREVSVLLDNLNMSTINNRVFALSADTQKIYERFALVLKDTINGVPTAYDDMDKLMREAGPQLEKQFKSMPPFVQTLVKSLPAKIGAAVGPEFLVAASSRKPEDDIKVAGEDGNKTSGRASSGKKKRKIPGIKALMSRKGALMGILRGAVEFIETRFPFLASATNVVLSLAVFSKIILLFPN